MVAISRDAWWLLCCIAWCTVAKAEDHYLLWDVAIINTSIIPGVVQQPVITINGMFPGPVINVSTNDNVHIDVMNSIEESLLMTWNGIQQRLNSWQDGVSGTNCAIQPGKIWRYSFQMKDQIGSFFYFPSINFQKAGGGYGAIRINNRININVPFSMPDKEYDLLIGDWYIDSFKEVRASIGTGNFSKVMLMNGNGPYRSNLTIYYESFTVAPGKTYRFRVSNVGNMWSFNFRIQSHRMLLVETEGSYPNQVTLDSLDVHVGQSYSVLVTADQNATDFYIVASPKWVNLTDPDSVTAVGILHYENSTTTANGPLPAGPDPFDINFSMAQAKSIKMNMTTGAARPNAQGSFNVTNVTLSQTFLLRASFGLIDGIARYTVNNVSYIIPSTPLKLADHYINGSGVYDIDTFPTHSSLSQTVNGTFVVSGTHKGWLELVFQNNLDMLDSWHLDGFGFFFVGFGQGEWTPEERSTSYNLYDPIVRSTVQVYPRGWTAVYVYLDNPGMWNLRSQNLKHWYLGAELYIRVYDPDTNVAKERSPPDNLMFCGVVESPPTPPSPPTPTNPFPPEPVVFPPPPPSSDGVMTSHVGWSSYYIAISTILAVIL